MQKSNKYINSNFLSFLLNKDTVELKLTYYKKDIFALSAYIDFIQDLIEKKEKVPPRVLKKVIDFVNNPVINELKTNIELTEQYKNKALQLLGDLPQEYNFKATVENKNILTFSGFLNTHLSNIIRTYLNKKNQKNIMSKVAEETYMQLDIYLKNVPEENHPYSLYFRSVICGIVCVAFDLLATKKQFKKDEKFILYNSYTQYLRNKTHHSCQKAKNKLKPPKKVVDIFSTKNYKPTNSNQNPLSFD